MNNKDATIVMEMLETASSYDMQTEVVMSAIEIARENPEYDMDQVCTSALIEWDLY